MEQIAHFSHVHPLGEIKCILKLVHLKIHFADAENNNS